MRNAVQQQQHQNLFTNSDNNADTNFSGIFLSSSFQRYDEQYGGGLRYKTRRKQQQTTTTTSTENDYL